MKNEGALRMRFSRQGGIYRSDVFSLLVNPVQMPPPVGRPRYRAIGRAGRSNTPCPSSAMSSALAIPQRVARQHCPSPLHQQCQIKSFARSAEMLYHRPVHSLLFVCLSSGDNPSFAEGLTTKPQESRQTGASEAFRGNTARTKKKMRACPSYLERFVQQTTSMKDWPL